MSEGAVTLLRVEDFFRAHYRFALVCCRLRFVLEPFDVPKIWCVSKDTYYKNEPGIRSVRGSVLFVSLMMGSSVFRNLIPHPTEKNSMTTTRMPDRNKSQSESFTGESTHTRQRKNYQWGAEFIRNRVPQSLFIKRV